MIFLLCFRSMSIAFDKITRLEHKSKVTGKISKKTQQINQRHGSGDSNTGKQQWGATISRP